jgi:hypothetical protein
MQDKDISQPAPQGEPSPPPEGIGFASKGVQTADTVLQALKGLQTGFMNAQAKKFDQLQKATLVAKMQYDAAVSHLKAFAEAGIPDTDPRVVAAKQAAEAADKEMTGRTEQLQSMVTGVKPGAKPKGGKGGEPGQEDPHGKLSKALHQVFHTVGPIGKALVTGQPRPLGPLPTSTPPFNPSPNPVPAAPASMTGQAPHGELST